MSLRLGTRRSALALAQSGMVARALGPDVTLVEVVTEGDRLVGVPLQGTLAKGYFTEALEAKLREGSIDLAVHSLKDLPVLDSPGLTLGAVPPRESPADLLLVRAAAFDAEAWRLPLVPGARVGAASLRRQALLRTLRPDLEPAFLRGNVTTRVRKLVDGSYDAIVLAEAGVVRLGETLGLPEDGSVVVARLLPEHWPCAPGQGALGIQCRADDPSVQARLARIHDPATAAAVGGERDALRSIGGGCATPFAAWFGESGRVLGMAPEEGGRFAILRDVRAVGPALDALRRGESEDWPSLVWEPWRAGLAPVPLA